MRIRRIVWLLVALAALAGCEKKEEFRPAAPSKQPGQFGPQRIPAGALPPPQGKPPR